MKSKDCFKCGKEKLVSDFYKDITKKDGLSSYCAECSRKAKKVYYEQNKERLLKKQRKDRKQNPKKYKEYDKIHYKKYKKQYIERSLKKNYGLTLDDYNKMFNEQQGCCAICGIHQSELKRALDTDHNHKNGQIRQLLCNSCNRLLGHSKENIEILKLAIKYLEKHNA